MLESISVYHLLFELFELKRLTILKYNKKNMQVFGLGVVTIAQLQNVLELNLGKLLNC